jgi:hypothetical protein
VGNDKPPFPRWVGRWVPPRIKIKDGKEIPFPEGYPRFLVDTKEEYFNAVERYKGVGAITSIYSEPMSEKRIINRLFLELGDSVGLHKPGVAHKQMQELSRFIYDSYGEELYILYTTNKSYHLHIGFKPIQIRPTIYNVQMDVVKSLLEDARKGGYLKTKIERFISDDGQILESYVPDCDLDWQCISDFRRCSRLPYTGHIGTMRRGMDMLVVPINWRWSLHRIIQESKNPSFSVDDTIPVIDNIYSLIKDFEKMYYDIEKSIPKRVSAIQKVGKIDFRKRIEWLMEIAPRIKDGWNRISTFVLVPMLRHSGFSTGEGLKVLEQWLIKSGCPHVAKEVYHAERYTWDKGYLPMKIEKLLEKNPDLEGYLV